MRKLSQEGLKKYNHSNAVTEDEIYFFRKPINPAKVRLDTKKRKIVRTKSNRTLNKLLKLVYIFLNFLPTVKRDEDLLKICWNVGAKRYRPAAGTSQIGRCNQFRNGAYRRKNFLTVQCHQHQIQNCTNLTCIIFIPVSISITYKKTWLLEWLFFRSHKNKASTDKTGLKYNAHAHILCRHIHTILFVSFLLVIFIAISLSFHIFFC